MPPDRTELRFLELLKTGRAYEEVTPWRGTSLKFLECSSGKGPKGPLAPLAPYTRRVTIRIPEPALVLLMGVAGSGKSTFAASHFRPTEVISSDQCRAMIADDPEDQSVSPAAFDLLHVIAGKRLDAGRLTVIDATNVLAWGRKTLLELAAAREVPVIAVVLDLPLELCRERNLARARQVPEAVIQKQWGDLQGSLSGLAQEGVAEVYRFTDPGQIAKVQIERD